MATTNFITNSTGEKAVRKETISTLEIVHYDVTEQSAAYYALLLYSTQVRSRVIEFEVDDTAEGIATKAATVLAALES